MEKLIEKKQFTLNLRDWLTGVYLGVVAPIVTLVLEQIGVGNFNLNWKQLGTMAISTFAIYVLKNWVQPTKVIVIDPAPDTLQAAKSGDRPNPLYPPGTPIHPKK